MSIVTQAAVSDVTGQAEPKQANINEAPQAPSEQDKLQAQRLASLAARERQARKIQQESQAARQARTQLESENAQLKSELEAFKARKQRLSEDPWSVLIEDGLTPEQISDRVFSPEAMDKYKLQSFGSDLKKDLQSQIDAVKAAQEQSQTQQYEQAKKQIRSEVKMLIDGDESFEAMKANGDDACDAVVDLIEATFKETGELMDVDAAAKEVEEYLIEEALKLAKLKKIQSKLNPPQENTLKTSVQEPRQQANTLTNRVTSNSSNSNSAKARRDRAIAAFVGTKQ